MQNIDELIKNNPVNVLQGMIKTMQQKRLENYKFLTGKPIASIQSGQIKPNEKGQYIKSAVTWYKNWLIENNHGQEFENEQLGTVIVAPSGIKAAMSHKPKPIDIQGLVALPYVVKKAKVLKITQDDSGKNIENTVIAAPILIDGAKAFVVVRLRRNTDDKNEKPRFYTQAIEIEKEYAPSDQVPRHSKMSAQHGGRTRLLNILHDALAVNPDTENLHGYDSASDPLAITPDNAVDVLQGMIKAIEQKRLENYKFLTGSPVCSIQSGQIKSNKDGKLINGAVDWMRQWLKENRSDGVFNHPQLGKVILSPRGIKDAMNHRPHPIDVQAIPAIPLALENSVLLDISRDDNNKPIDNAIIAAPIVIDEKTYYLVVRLRKDLATKDSQPRFYTCAAELVEETKKVTSLMTSPISEAEGRIETGGRDRLLNILHDALAVNPDTENLQGFDSASDPLAITTDNAVDVLQGMIKTMLSVPARADTSLLDVADTDIEIVKIAYKNAQEKYAKRPAIPIRIFSDNSIVLLGWQGIKHALSDQSNTLNALATTCIRELIEKAVFVEKLPLKGKNKHKIIQTLLYSSDFLIGKEVAAIGIVIQVYADGRRLYDYFKLVEHKKSTVSTSELDKTLGSTAQPLTVHGHNIINSANIVKGRTNTVKTAKGTKIDTVFAVVEADKVIASHTATGAANPNYPQELQPRDRSRDASVAWVQKTANNLDPDSLGRTGRADTGAPIVGSDLCVESGNGRTMAIVRMVAIVIFYPCR